MDTNEHLVEMKLAVCFYADNDNPVSLGDSSVVADLFSGATK